METKAPSQNIQDAFLNSVRREKMAVTIFLISGVKLIGKIKGFDKYSVILEANNQEQLIFKHAISTVTTAKVNVAASVTPLTHTPAPATPPTGTPEPRT
jgi:host factor-I protein